MIISFVNQKGGVGKSTTAINLAASLKRKNYNLVLVDADPQGSVVQWHAVENNNAFEILHHPEPLDRFDIKELAADYDYILIDAPPAIGNIAKSILEVSDLAVVPISPSSLDIWSGWGTLEMIEEARQANPDLMVRLLVNRKIPGTRVGRDAREAIEVFDMEIFQTELCQRVAFIDAMASGVSVMQYAPTSKAAGEIEGLTDEVILLSEVEEGAEEEERLHVNEWNSLPEGREEHEEASPWQFRFDR